MVICVRESGREKERGTGKGKIDENVCVRACDGEQAGEKQG